MRNIYVFALNINEVCENDINLLHKKQQERIKNIKNERARKQALAAELLVFYSIKKLRPKNIPIPPLRAAGEFGKPYFTENSDFKFNISHSGDWAVIAVSDCEIGIDIEKIGKLRTNVAKRILHEKEKQEFFALNVNFYRIKFYDYWVLKESIVKATGRGMNDSFSDICIKFVDEITPQIDEKQLKLFLLPFENEYKIGICIFTKEKYKIFTKILSYCEIIVYNYTVK